MLADAHGNVIHLGERDCSVQRRHQKLIEESPAPAVDDELRERIGKIAIDAARGRRLPLGAGTIEGLLQDGEYFFLEMNTRVQVEHCVTEMVTGIDIVREQIRDRRRRAAVASRQDDVVLRGHAIECRINAEDALEELRARARARSAPTASPPGPGVRVDSGVERRAREITPLYDPMVAKLIVWDADRERATAAHAARAREYEIERPQTLIPFHKALLATEQWAQRRDLPRPDRGQGVAEGARLPEAADAGRRRGRGRDGRARPTPSRSPASASTSRSSASRSPAAARRERRRAARPRQRRERARAQRAAAAAAATTLASPLQGNVCKVLVEQGAEVEEGAAHLHHRGDEDGERDHRPQGGRRSRAADQRGRRDRSRRHDRDDHIGASINAPLERLPRSRGARGRSRRSGGSRRRRGAACRLTEVRRRVATDARRQTVRSRHGGSGSRRSRERARPTPPPELDGDASRQPGASGASRAAARCTRGACGSRRRGGQRQRREAPSRSSASR